MTFQEQALLKGRHQVLEFDAQEQFALGTYEGDDERENRGSPSCQRPDGRLRHLGLVMLADWAFYDGQHVQMVVDLLRGTGTALGREV